LQTLPKREFSAGMAEVIKYGLLGDVEFYDYLNKNIDLIMNFDKEVIKYIIFNSCENKANIVAKDEFEGGVRALLNLGHTFGHAIENTKGYGVVLHGEAVGIGMLMAAKMSNLEGHISNDEVLKVKELLEKSSLPTAIAGKITIADFTNAMSVDKKALGGEVKLILLKEIGKAFITKNYKQDNANKVISEFCN
jgi:3-dehydroquinate synthase